MSEPQLRAPMLEEIARLREQAEALATALRNQGLLQNTFHGTVWHIHDCREPTESLFAANAEREFARMAHGDNLAQFKADQLDAWERTVHTKYLDDQLVERCITCLERWPCKEDNHDDRR